MDIMNYFVQYAMVGVALEAIRCCRVHRAAICYDYAGFDYRIGHF
jgi:hypothetical protein